MNIVISFSYPFSHPYLREEASLPKSLYRRVCTGESLPPSLYRRVATEESLPARLYRRVSTEGTRRKVFEEALSDAHAKTSPSRACLSHLSIGYREHRWAHGRRRCQHLIEGYHLL